MIVWLAILLMTALVLAALLLPLLRRQDTQVSREILESAVHRDRLAEVKRDLDRGLLTAAEAQAAETEISRLILAAAEEAKSGRAGKGGDQPGVRKVAAALVAIIVPIGGLLLYFGIGAPGEPGYPLAARTDTARPPVTDHQGTELAGLIDRLTERMEQEPDNLEGWILLGRSAYAANQYRRAVEAFRNARRLAGPQTDIDALFAESLVAVAGGMVTAEARQIFETIAAADPSDLGARYYIGLAKAQAGEPRVALETWAAVLAEAPPGTPWAGDLRNMMQRLADEQGFDLAAIAPQAPAAAPTAPGPTAEDIRAARSMSAGDQSEMIRGMVARLAERLEQNPDDPEGWLRLGRSYLVLGEPEKAREALDRAVAAGAQVPADLAGQIAASSGTPRAPAAETAEGDGPTREEVAAAALETPPEDREAMIRGMVAKLAARLEDTPDDFQGWMRLGRSYSVLGEPDKAKSALARAVSLEPGNLDAVIAYSGATLIAPAPREELPAESVSAMRGLLDQDPASPPALWYVGMAEAQGGNAERAAALWGRLLVRLEPGSREYATVKSRIETLTW